MRRILILCFFLVSCGANTQNNNNNVIKTEKQMPIDVFGIASNEYQIVTIDSCEYIVGWSGTIDGGPFMTHKGNCKNPVHASK